MSADPQQTGKAVPTSGESEDRAFRSRLSAVVKILGSAKAAADAAEVAQTTIDRWRTGPQMPPFDRVIALCRAAKIHVEWVATGEGPRDIQPRSALSPEGTEREQELGRMIQVQSHHDAPGHADMVLLPRLSVQASAGQGVIPADEEIEEFLALKAEFLYQLGVNPRNAHVLQIKGDSMYPTFRNHDVIIVDASLVEVQEEGLYTIVYNEAVFAKRIQPLRDGSLRIASDNKTAGYIDEIVPASERHTLKIVGRIRGVYRNL